MAIGKYLSRNALPAKYTLVFYNYYCRITTIKKDKSKKLSSVISVKMLAVQKLTETSAIQYNIVCKFQARVKTFLACIFSALLFKIFN